MARLLLNLKKDLKIPYARISFVYLLIVICTLHAKFQNAFLWKLLVVQNWNKIPHLPQPTTQQRSLLEKFYIWLPLLSVMTLNYQRLHQISSLEANFSSEDMK